MTLPEQIARIDMEGWEEKVPQLVYRALLDNKELYQQDSEHVLDMLTDIGASALEGLTRIIQTPQKIYDYRGRVNGASIDLEHIVAEVEEEQTTSYRLLIDGQFRETLEERPARAAPLWFAINDAGQIIRSETLISTVERLPRGDAKWTNITAGTELALRPPGWSVISEIIRSRGNYYLATDQQSGWLIGWDRFDELPIPEGLLSPSGNYLFDEKTGRVYSLAEGTDFAIPENLTIRQWSPQEHYAIATDRENLPEWYRKFDSTRGVIFPSSEVIYLVDIGTQSIHPIPRNPRGGIFLTDDYVCITGKKILSAIPMDHITSGEPIYPSAYLVLDMKTLAGSLEQKAAIYTRAGLKNKILFGSSKGGAVIQLSPVRDWQEAITYLLS